MEEGFHLPPSRHARLARLACEAASCVVVVGLDKADWVGRGGLNVGSKPSVLRAGSALVHVVRWQLSSVVLIGRQMVSLLFFHTHTLLLRRFICS